MTTLTELEALARAAKARREQFPLTIGFTEEEIRLLASISTATILDMIALIRQMGEALEIANSELRSGTLWVGRSLAKVTVALTAYKEICK